MARHALRILHYLPRQGLPPTTQSQSERGTCDNQNSPFVLANLRVSPGLAFGRTKRGLTPQAAEALSPQLPGGNLVSGGGSDVLQFVANDMYE